MHRSIHKVKHMLLRSFMAVVFFSQCGFLPSLGGERTSASSGAQASPIVVYGVETIINAQENDYWFEDIDEGLSISFQLGENLADYVSGLIFDENVSRPDVTQFLARDIEPRMVFLSLSDGRSSARVFLGRGTGMARALDDVVDQADKYIQDGFIPIWLQLDLVEEVFPFEDVDPNSPQPSDFERSLYGLAFDQGSGIAFLPGELVAKTIIDSNQRIRFTNMDKYFQSSRRDTLLPNLKKLMEQETVSLYRFSTRSYFSDSDEVFELYRGHRLFGKVEADEAYHSAVKAGEYLARTTGQDGRFVYIYLPKTNEIPNRYNIVRHAGTVWSMFELYSAAPDPELFKAAERALKDYLLGVAAQPCSFEGEVHLCIVEDQQVKLGSNALATVALAKYIEISGDREYLGQLQSLGNWMLAVMDPESGEFRISTVSYPDNVPTFAASLYYPGEAILGFIRIYQLDKDPKWLDAAEKAAQWLINVRDIDKPVKSLIHDHWLLYGLNELYRERPKTIYLRHALNISQSIIWGQNLDPPYPDWMGSYYKPPRSTPAATRAEGMLAAYRMVKDFGHPEDAQTILEAVDKMIAFQLQMQFRPETSMFIDNPEFAMGGFRADLTNYEIRNDYVQHNMASLISYADIYRQLEEEKIQSVED